MKIKDRYIYVIREKKDDFPELAVLFPIRRDEKYLDAARPSYFTDFSNRDKTVFRFDLNLKKEEGYEKYSSFQIIDFSKFVKIHNLLMEHEIEKIQREVQIQLDNIESFKKMCLTLEDKDSKNLYYLQSPPY